MPRLASPTRRGLTSLTTSPSSTGRAGGPSPGSGSGAGGWSYARAESASPPARVGDLLSEPAACRHGCHDRQRRASVDPPGPERVAFWPAVDHRRLHPGVGEPADVVRLDGRQARTPAYFPDGTGPVHLWFAAVQPGARSGMADRV